MAHTKPEYKLIMSSGTAKAETIATGHAESEMGAIANQIATAFRIANFRGGIMFTIQIASVAHWTAEVTFTDDMPNGYWNVIHN